MSNTENLKDVVENGDVSKETILVLEEEILASCELLADIDKKIDDNKKTLESLKDTPVEELQKDVDDLQDEMKNIKDGLEGNTNTGLGAELNKTNKNISSLNNKKKDLDETISKAGNICEWGENIDVVIGILRGFIDENQKETNKSQEQIDDNNKIIDKLIKEKDGIEVQLKQVDGTNGTPVNPTLNKQIDELSKSKKDTENVIKDLEDQICTNKDTWSDLDFSKATSQLNTLTQLNKNLDKTITNKSSDLSKNLEPIETSLTDTKNKLDASIDKLRKENKNLEKPAKDFSAKKLQEFGELGDVVSAIPVIINIICSLPKLVINIIIGILNSISNMKNLPILWEFPYVI